MRGRSPTGDAHLTRAAETPHAFVATLQGELDAAYARTLEGLRGEHPIFQVAQGAIDVKKLDALEEPASLKALRGRVEAMLPDGDLPELLLETAARTRFTEAFAHEREPSARLTDLHVSICAVLIAQASDRPGVQRRLQAAGRRERAGAAAGAPEEQLGARGLVVNCIVLYNTIYTQRALDHLKAEGYDIHREDIRRLSPWPTSTSPSPATTT